MTNLKKILIFGGTHGNEWTGITIVREFSETIKAEFPELDIEFIFANPEAYKINKRYQDEDLNRAFENLNESRPHSYEHVRAKEIKEIIDRAPCFVLDLHTTTSNMGKTVIICHENTVNLKVASELTRNLPSCRAILSPDPQKKYLASQSIYGMMIEVGPVANGTINPVTLQDTIAVIRGVLKGFSGASMNASNEIEVYDEIQDIYYPQNKEGELTAHIHEAFQNADFTALLGTYTPFRTYKNEVIKMETNEELFPIFINEAAYYPKKLAFTLCRKRKICF